MKILILITLALISFVLSTIAYSTNISTYNALNGVVHIPILKVINGNEADPDFTVNLQYYSNNSSLEIIDIVPLLSTRAYTPDTSTYNALNGVVHIPILKVINGSEADPDFTVDLQYYSNKSSLEIIDIVPTYDIADYFPMNKSKIFHEEFSAFEDESLEKDWTKITFSDTITYNGELVVLMNDLYGVGTTPDDNPVFEDDITFEKDTSTYFSLDERGLLVWGIKLWEENHLITLPPIQITSKQISLGQTWETPFSIDGETIIAHYKFISTGEIVNTPVGTFTDTIQIYERIVSNERYIWFAKGLGIVKVDSINEGDIGVFGFGDMNLIKIDE